MEIVVESSGGLPESGTLLVAAGHDGNLGTAAAELDRRADGLLRRALEAAGERKNGKVVELFVPAGLGLDRVLILVVGKPEGLRPLDLAELGGTVIQRLRQARVAEAAVAGLGGLDLPVPPAEAMGELALGMQLRGYRFGKYRTSEPDDERSPLARVRVLDPEAGPAVERAAGLAEAVTSARDLVSEPANVLTPAVFAQACAGLRAEGLEVEVLERAELERLGMRALLAVARGSAEPPYVAVMRWRGDREGGPPTALVGKGVCFDTGGISIKPAAGMEEMKFDMAGAAAVYGAMRALARRRARADVVGLVGLVENMPSGTAQRPGDVVTSMAGKTIEVVNTDAEGRLLLADVLWYAQDRFKPRAMVDLATLTGAVIVALGREQAGLFASDDALAAALIEAGAETGERMWRMPLGKAYDKHIKSDIADVKNVGRGREAGSVAGAVFLQQFTNGVPWAHLDIAAMAWATRDLPLAPKGATGYGVRLLDRYVASVEDGGAEAGR